jgi:2-keto-3-deoxy-L-fuconate dehydrogenase
LRSRARARRSRPTDINLDKLQELAATPGITARKLDVTDRSAIVSLANELRTPQILLNCAGFVHHGTVLECTDQDWAFAFDLNARSMYYTISALLPRMVEQGGGSIIISPRLPAASRVLPIGSCMERARRRSSV